MTTRSVGAVSAAATAAAVAVERLVKPQQCQRQLLWAGRILFGKDKWRSNNSKDHNGPSHNRDNHPKTSQRLQQGSVLIDSDGTIQQCFPGQTEESAKQLSSSTPDCHFQTFGPDSVLLPGLMDVHCHISELGDRDWEGYYSATRAAAAGGLTTLMGMPLNSLPPTVDNNALWAEQQRATDTPLLADVGLWGGVLPETLCDGRFEHDMIRMGQSRPDGTNGTVHDGGVLGIKAFLAPLPVAAGYQAISPSELETVASHCGQAGIPLLVHSELMTMNEVERQTEDAYTSQEDPFRAHAASRPALWEREAIRVVCALADRCHMHIVHLSDAGSLDLIRATKRQSGTRLTVETCPHYMMFSQESVTTTQLKCFPPIRDESNRQSLWNDGLLHGGSFDDGEENALIDMVGSDHSPCTPSMREGPMREVWGGVAGLQYQLPATLTSMDRHMKVSDRTENEGRYDHNNNTSSSSSHDDDDDYANADVDNDDNKLRWLSKWWSKAPSELIPGFSSIKGTIETGKQADLCVVDPTALFAGKERHRWKNCSPFSTMPLRGKVVAAFVNGTRVYDGETDQLIDEIGVDSLGGISSASAAPGRLWVRRRTTSTP